MTTMIVHCAGCGKAYRGTPGRNRYKCARCSNLFTFPSRVHLAPKGQLFCSCCWNLLSAENAPGPCPACKQNIAREFGGRASESNQSPKPAQNLPGPSVPLVVHKSNGDGNGHGKGGVPGLDDPAKLRRRLKKALRRAKALDLELDELRENLDKAHREIEALRKAAPERPVKAAHQKAKGRLTVVLEKLALESASGQKDAHADRGHKAGMPRPKKLGAYASPASKSFAGKTRLLFDTPPPAITLLALRNYVSQEDTVNASVLVTVHLKGVQFSQALAELKAHGFVPLPHYKNQDTYQRAIFEYFAQTLEAKPTELCCGAKNVALQDRKRRGADAASEDIIWGDTQAEPFVDGVRESLRKRFPKAALNYFCFPALNLSKLALQTAAPECEQEPPSGSFTGGERITAHWLRARSRDLMLVSWFARRWPDGANLKDVVGQIENADWLIELLAHTRYHPHTAEGRRMLVRLACLCAVRAQRWAPQSDALVALAAAERWLEHPNDANRELAGRIVEYAKKEQHAHTGNDDSPLNYIRQGVMESAWRAAQTVQAERYSMTIEAATRAAVAAVVTASLASKTSSTSSWLSMLNGRISFDEPSENREICKAILRIIDSGKTYPAKRAATV